MKLTENFDLSEFVESSTAKRLNIDNTPSDEVISNLKRLCYLLLQPLRNIINEPIIINSGFRCASLNKAVGGVSSSQHKLGLAADIVCYGFTSFQLFTKIKQLCEADKSILLIDQCIVYDTFVHVSVPAVSFLVRYQFLDNRKK